MTHDPLQRAPLQQAYVPATDEVAFLDITIGDLLRLQAKNYGDHEAVVEAGADGQTARRWTYSELTKDAEAIARRLAAEFAPGERVVVWSQNGPEWVLFEIAAAMAGLVLVTANPSFRAQELQYVLQQSGAVALFHGAVARGMPLKPIADEATKDLSKSVTVRNLVDVCEDRSETGALPEVLPNDPAQIQYTSGTTGFPKGALLPHRGLVNNARFSAGRSNLGPEHTHLHLLPMFHTGGCGTVTLGVLQAGARMVLIEEFNPSLAGELIETQGITHFIGVPTMLLAILNAYHTKSFETKTLQYVLSGGAMVAPAVAREVQEVFGCKFETVYGQTEYCPLISQHGPEDDLDDICNSVGRALPQTEISIRRAADNTVANIGETGEICARGPCVMIGYNDNPEATAATVDADGWLHTGDLGEMDDRGFLKVTGRLKEMIIRGGENLFPAEIENTLLDHPDVANVAVVGLPDDSLGEIVAAFITPVKGADCNSTALKHYCRQHLSPQKTPVVWKHAASFPLTGPGKIQKFKLVETSEDYPDL